MHAPARAWLKDMAVKNPQDFREQFEAAKEAIGHASLALEGIRVIVTA